MNSSLVMLSVQRKTTRSVMRSTEMYDMIAHSEHKSKVGNHYTKKIKVGNPQNTNIFHEYQVTNKHHY
jgi:hypothetical protein